MTTETILLIMAIVAVLIFGFWMIQQSRYRHEERQRLFDLKRESQKAVSPIRLRAYERLALLLERTTPEHMLMGLDINTMSVSQLQQHLLQTLRAEYEHNMSQQVYVSESVWAQIMNARNQMAAFIVAAAAQLPPDATALTYAQTLLTAYTSNGTTPSEAALSALKNEAQTLM